MNERIKELLLKAQDLARTEVENDPSIKPPYLIPATQVHKGLGLSYKKFAELLVQECISIVAKRKDRAIDDGWNVDEAMSMAEMDLLEYLGVEE